MKLQSYAISDKSEDGALYAVVTLEDGSTFGQWLLPGTAEELDAQVQAAVKRQAPLPDISALLPLMGSVRTAADVAVAAEATSVVSPTAAPAL